MSDTHCPACNMACNDWTRCERCGRDVCDDCHGSYECCRTHKTAREVADSIDLGNLVGAILDNPAAASPLAVDCRRCRAKAGKKCRNYKGQNKQTCPERGTPEPAKPTWQPDLFSTMCADSVAEQQTLFPPDPPRKADGPRIPDLPGQMFLELDE
jgi:hypothetical protein